MITRLEVDGFKSLRSFAIDFAPFTVLVGPNSAGKSNILEALAMLAHLASEPIEAAFKHGRGRAIDQFTLEQGQPSRAVRFAAEVLLPAPVETGEGATNRLRYELTIARERRASGAETLVVEHERLATISEPQDTWSPPPSTALDRAQHAPAMDLLLQLERTRKDLRNLKRRLRIAGDESLVAPESHTALSAVSAGLETYLLSLMFGVDVIRRIHETAKLHDVSAREFAKSILLERLGVEQAELPAVESPTDAGFKRRSAGPSPERAVGRSLSALRMIHLDSMRLHEESERIGSAALAPDASNLPTVLAALPPRMLGEIRADLIALVPGLSTFDIVSDRESFRIDFELSGGERLPARLVSEGTLRALALLTALRSEPTPSIIAIEEPENGIYPGRLQALLDLLREASCERGRGPVSGAETPPTEDEDESEDRDGALAAPQIIVTSHSPVVLTALRHEPGCLRFIDIVRRGGRLSTRARGVGTAAAGDHRNMVSSPASSTTSERACAPEPMTSRRAWGSTLRPSRTYRGLSGSHGR